MRQRSFFRSLHTDFLEPRLMLSADAFAGPAHAQASPAAEIATVRHIVAHYHRVEVAMEDGFQQFKPGGEDVCIDPDAENPGTVGKVYLNGERIDGVLNVNEPEALFYETMKNGRQRLVGVEYAVTQEAWDEAHPGEEGPPELFGEEFHQNDNAGLYGIHIWLKHNKDGIHALEHTDIC